MEEPHGFLLSVSDVPMVHATLRPVGSSESRSDRVTNRPCRLVQARAGVTNLSKYALVPARVYARVCARDARI